MHIHYCSTWGPTHLGIRKPLQILEDHDFDELLLTERLCPECRVFARKRVGLLAENEQPDRALNQRGINGAVFEPRQIDKTHGAEVRK